MVCWVPISLRNDQARGARTNPKETQPWPRPAKPGDAATPRRAGETSKTAPPIANQGLEINNIYQMTPEFWRLARRGRGAYPQWICIERATPPAAKRPRQVVNVIYFQALSRFGALTQVLKPHPLVKWRRQFQFWIGDQLAPSACGFSRPNIHRRPSVNHACQS